ncbi:hypothetical protein HPB47_019056, partial [Ixodes persulcatus]
TVSGKQRGFSLPRTPPFLSSCRRERQPAKRSRAPALEPVEGLCGGAKSARLEDRGGGFDPTASSRGRGGKVSGRAKGGIDRAGPPADTGGPPALFPSREK